LVTGRHTDVAVILLLNIIRGAFDGPVTGSVNAPAGDAQHTNASIDAAIKPATPRTKRPRVKPTPTPPGTAAARPAQATGFDDGIGRFLPVRGRPLVVP
jgi:hypothetical protein